MTTSLRISPHTRPRGVALSAAVAAFAITAAIVAAIATGMAAPGDSALARYVPPEAARIATRADAPPIEVTIHPSSVHVVGVVVERTASNRPVRARG